MGRVSGLEKASCSDGDVILCWKACGVHKYKYAIMKKSPINRIVVCAGARYEY